MEHSWMFWTGLVIVTVVLVRKFVTRNHVIISRYDYLEAISFTEWKTGLQIKRQLESEKRARIGGEFYVNMSYLEENGFIVSRLHQEALLYPGQLSRREYLKKNNGKSERSKTSDDLTFSPVLQPA